MNLNLNNQLFLVGGATGGLGNAIAHALIAEGALIIAIARSASKLADLQHEYPQQVEIVVGSLFESSTLQKIMEKIGTRKISGAIINAGGPPAMPAMQTTLEDWDNAYQNVVRWKIELTQLLVKKMIPHNYGRIVYVESVSVKHPIENLVLSNAMRLAVVGYVKTLSQEIGQHGITLNILGPGYHTTQRLENVFVKNSEIKGVPVEDVKAQFINQTKVGDLGKPDDFASLALWFLSPQSRYITGQTISVDGGLIKGTFG